MEFLCLPFSGMPALPPLALPAITQHYLSSILPDPQCQSLCLLHPVNPVMKGWTQQAGSTVLWSVTVFVPCRLQGWRANILILKNSGDSVLFTWTFVLGGDICHYFMKEVRTNRVKTASVSWLHF